MEIVTEEDLEKFRKLVKLGANPNSNVKSLVSYSRSTTPLLQLPLLQIDKVTLSQTGYAALGLSRLFAHKCSRYLELLNKKWKVMIGWVLTKPAVPIVSKLNETMNESELTVIERILDGEPFEDLSKATSAGSSVGTLHTAVASPADKDLATSREASEDSSQDSLQNLSRPDPILPKLGLSLSSGLSEDRTSVPVNFDNLETPIPFDPTDCLDKLSLSLLEDTGDIQSLSSSQLPNLDFNVLNSHEQKTSESPYEVSPVLTEPDPDRQSSTELDSKKQTVIDAIFTGLSQIEDEPDEHDSRAIFRESQRELIISNANTETLDRDLALQQPTPQPLERPTQLPKSLLNLPEDSLESESDLSLSVDSTPHLVEICDEEYDEETCGAYKRRNQQKSRYDIRIHLDPRHCRGQDELASMLSDTSATKKTLKKPVKLAYNFPILKIPAWSELLEGSNLLSQFQQKPAESRFRRRRPFRPIGTSSVGSWNKKVTEDVIEVNHPPIESARNREILDDLSVDDVVRDAMEDYNPELSELSLIRPPPAVGRENAEGQLQYGHYEAMKALPYDESELLFCFDDDRIDTPQSQRKFEMCLIRWLKERGGRDTLENIVNSMPRETEHLHFELGDLVHELISLESPRFLIQQAVKQASEPILIILC